MKKLALLAILILTLVPPASRVVDPPECLGICIFDGAVPLEQTLPPDDQGGS
jgi:hypothetical protein